MQLFPELPPVRYAIKCTTKTTRCPRYSPRAVSVYQPGPRCKWTRTHTSTPKDGDILSGFPVILFYQTSNFRKDLWLSLAITPVTAEVCPQAGPYGVEFRLVPISLEHMKTFIFWLILVLLVSQDIKEVHLRCYVFFSVAVCDMF